MTRILMKICYTGGKELIFLIKLIATDLDGTLLMPDGKPGPRTLAAIDAFCRQGGIFVPVTGRRGPNVPEFIRENSSIAYVIFGNGGRCVKNDTFESVFVNPIPAPVAARALTALMDYNALWLIFHDKICLDVQHKAGMSEEEAFRLIREPGITIEKLDIYPDDIKDKPEMWEKVSHIPELVLSCAGAPNIELNDPEGQKGKGVSRLARMLGIRKDEIMAFGDGLNDMSMLEASGFPVAMGNAVDELKAAAGYITLTNAEEGVAAAIEKFALI